VIPAEGGPPVAEFFPPAENYGVRWMPDGTGVTFCRRTDEGRGLYRADLHGENIEKILSLDDGRILDHNWSTDGTQIHFHKRVGSTDSIWIVPASGGKPQLLTRFPTGNISGHRWTLDDRHILFAHGRTTREVVQIREAAQATN
jgi:Tol biopolymer transport system component